MNEENKLSNVFQTARFGEIHVEAERIIRFVAGGIVGFPSAVRFVLLSEEGKPFSWLQSLDDPSLAFVVIDPYLFRSDYNFVIDATSEEELEAKDAQDIMVLSLVTVPHDNPSKPTANLEGPLVVNMQSMKAKQLILYNSGYSTQEKIAG